MAVTLYRCSKCRGVFNSVFDTFGGRLCRDCKLIASGYGGEVKFAPAEQVKIVGDEEETVGGIGVQSAVGLQKEQAQDLYNNAPPGVLSGSSGYQFKFSGWQEKFRSEEGNKYYDINSNTFVERWPDGTLVRYDGDGKVVEAVPLRDQTAEQKVVPTFLNAEKPESSPHDAILKPSRKLKLLAE